MTTDISPAHHHQTRSNQSQFIWYEVKRLSTEKAPLFFSIALPVFFYLVFGKAQSYADYPIGNGNVAAYVMIGLALFAGVTGVVGSAGSAVLENQSGWSRNLALTPLSTHTYLTAKATNIAIRAILPVAAVFLTGILTGAHMPLTSWIACFTITVLCCLPFGFYGLIWPMLSPAPSVVSIAASSAVVLGFAGNLFLPLEGTLLTISRFTPLYGPALLARWPLTHGQIANASSPDFLSELLFWAVTNLVVWTVVFVGAWAVLNKKDKKR